MIGPTFGSELEAAGLAGLPFSWSAAGEITYGEAITSEQQSSIEAVLAAHNPQAIPINRRDQLMDEIQQATSIADIKGVLLKLL